jgi:arylsulfatase
MNRREFIASVCATMVAPAVYGTARAQAKPNIVVILADDMGWADVGHELSKIDTPNLGRLERQGMKLTQFYAASPVCSPTRAALLTGRYPHSAGMPAIASPEVRGNVPILSLSHDAVTIPQALKPAGYTSMLVPILSLSHDAVTIPQALKPAGYTSMLAGKWHLGHPRENWPRTYGFDEFWGSLAGTPGYYTVKDAYHNETPIEVDGYFTDRITDKAIEFIEKTQDKPFFLFLSYNAPHYPLEAPQDLIEKYKPRYDHPLFPIYAAMVDRLDFGIGRVMKSLRTTARRHKASRTG